MNNNEATVESINEVIALFEGRKRAIVNQKGKQYLYWSDSTGTNPLYSEELFYNESWDWLMPVVEKIEKIKGVHCVISELGCDIYSFGKHISNVGGRETKIANVCEAVFVFIQWYNQQTKPEHYEQSKTSN